MKAIPALALVSIGALCLVGPMPAHARNNGGGHNGNSGSHMRSQSHSTAAKSQGTKKKGNKEPYMKYEMKNATVSAAKAGKKKGKVTISPININKKSDSASP
jgi:type VI protein secretion system component Hcp